MLDVDRHSAWGRHLRLVGRGPRRTGRIQRIGLCAGTPCAPGPRLPFMRPCRGPRSRNSFTGRAIFARMARRPQPAYQWSHKKVGF
jgi:hypothetical protein